MFIRSCLLIAVLALQASQTAFAQIDTMVGTFPVAGQVVDFELCATHPGYQTSYSGRGRSPAEYDGNGKVTRSPVEVLANCYEITTPSSPWAGTCRMSMTFAETKYHSGFAYTRQYSASGPMASTMTFNMENAGVWGGNAPAQITMTRGTTTQRKYP